MTGRREGPVMTDETKQEKTPNEKAVSAATALVVWWFLIFVCGVAGIVLVRAWMWVWRVTEL